MDFQWTISTGKAGLALYSCSKNDTNRMVKIESSADKFDEHLEYLEIDALRFLISRGIEPLPTLCALYRDKAEYEFHPLLQSTANELKGHPLPAPILEVILSYAIVDWDGYFADKVRHNEELFESTAGKAYAGVRVSKDGTFWILPWLVIRKHEQQDKQHPLRMYIEFS